MRGYKFVSADTDRHGNRRFYFRRRGHRKVRLNGIPGSELFNSQYAAALAGSVSAKPKDRVLPDSFAFVAVRYFSSPEFKGLDQATQKQRRYFLEAICKVDGEKPIASLNQKHVRKMIESRARKPAAARNLLNSIRAMLNWAKANNFVIQNVAEGVKSPRSSSAGHATWSPTDIAKYEAQHALGSQARLAMALLLYTGCRREDVVRLGPQHISNDRVKYTQAKNEHRYSVRINIPVHSNLRQVIDSSLPLSHMTFLVTAHGKPFTAAGFGNKFRDWCNEAGLRGLSSHGLRKALATQLAEGGATAFQIMAITGHKTLSEVERYTKEANKARLADRALAKLKSRT